MRPFLKWAGNKYTCLEILQKHLPKGQRLVEPFMGSAALSLNADFGRYLLADINRDLVTLYNYLQQEGPKFINYCARHFTQNNNTGEVYYSKREKFNQLKASRQRAALFLYLNRHGYNGLCRYNLSGGYNVPFGRYKKPYFPRQEMLHFHEKSHAIAIHHKDYVSTLEEAKQGDVIYCDPPYAPISKTAAFTSYAARSFGQPSQEKLAELALQTSKKRGIPVLISNHDLPFTRHLYKGADFSMLSVKRSISQNGATRKPVDEILAFFPPSVMKTAGNSVGKIKSKSAIKVMAHHKKEQSVKP